MRALLLVLLLLAPRLTAAAESPLAGITTFKLKNGLEVLLLPDRSVPKVVVVTWIRTGSRDEDPGRTGFAHLFEHLMFKGTKAIADGRMDAILEEAGGFSSAFTTQDMTVYWEDASSNFLETILWIEGDRLATLVDDFDPAKLANQKDVVRNERRFGIDNAPYGKSQPVIQAALWPADHPYHWLVIGSHEDLVAAQPDDVVKFFKRHYVAANATMVIAGDFDPAQARALVEKHLGPLATQKVAARRTAPAPQPLAAMAKHTLDDDVQVPRTYFAFRGPARWAADEVPLQLAVSVLGQGKTSRLYQRLVYRERLAQNVFAYFSPADFGGEVQIVVTAKPEASIDKINQILVEELERLAKEPVSKAELERAKRKAEVDLYHSVEVLRDRAVTAASYQVSRGKPDLFAEDLARVGQADAAKLKEAAVKWLIPTSRVEVLVRPRGGK
jgi:zinc protease